MLHRGLHSTVAWAMSKSALNQDATHQRVLDLMCGRGLLSLEAVHSCGAVDVTALDDGALSRESLAVMINVQTLSSLKIA